MKIFSANPSFSKLKFKEKPKKGPPKSDYCSETREISNIIYFSSVEKTNGVVSKKKQKKKKNV